MLDSQPTDGLENGLGCDEEDADNGVVWDGEIDCSGKKVPLLFPAQANSRPLKLSAFALQEKEEGELHNRIFPRVLVKGYISLGDMEKYIEAKRKMPEVKMVLAFKLVPRQHSRVQYDALVEELAAKQKGMCLIDDRNWGGLLYALPSTSPSVSNLMPFGAEECLVAVAVTDRYKREAAPKRHQPDEIRQDVTNDFAKATGSMEKTVMLKLKKGACNLRLRAVAGDVGLGQVPEELNNLSKMNRFFLRDCQ